MAASPDGAFEKLTADLSASGRKPLVELGRSNISGTAADAVPMTKPKPRAMRVQLVVPLIRSGEVTLAQWSGVRHRKDALKPLDFSNGLLGVHSVSISNISTATVKRDGINEVSAHRPC